MGKRIVVFAAIANFYRNLIAKRFSPFFYSRAFYILRYLGKKFPCTWKETRFFLHRHSFTLRAICIVQTYVCLPCNKILNRLDYLNYGRCSVFLRSCRLVCLIPLTSHAPIFVNYLTADFEEFLIKSINYKNPQNSCNIQSYTKQITVHSS